MEEENYQPNNVNNKKRKGNKGPKVETQAQRINRLKDTFFLLNYNQGLARIKKQEWRDVIFREKPSREILLLMASLEISNPANSCIDL
jgi:hypothetical protein